MQAGFSREKITPPLGTMMMGSSRRDRGGGCDSIHDDLFVRALYLAHEGEEALIVSFDLLFLGRADADRFKGALGAATGLAARQVLLATTHTHASPSVGTWARHGYLPPDELYLQELQAALLKAAGQAKDAPAEVGVRAGAGTTTLPMSRRRPGPDGKARFAPYPDGVVHEALSVVLLEDSAGRPVCAMVSASCHPSIASGFEVSAEFPGVTCAALDEQLGAPVSMFLQGVAGDAKPANSGRGRERWAYNDWSLVDQAGRTLAQEAADVMADSLARVQPELRTAIVEERLPLAGPPSRREFDAIAKDYRADISPLDQDLRVLWAHRQLELLDRRGRLADSVGILVQGVQLGQGLRLVAIEGEPVAELGPCVEGAFGGGLTIPLGYANGQGLYLPVSHMLPEGGYEVESFFEYELPAPLAEGAEVGVGRAVERLKAQGIG